MTLKNQRNISLHQLFSAFGETEIWPCWKKSFKNLLMSKKCSLWHFLYLSFHQVHTNRKTQPCAAHTEQNWCGGFEERPQKIWGALSCGNLKNTDSVAPGCWQTFGVTYWLGVAIRYAQFSLEYVQLRLFY